MDAGQLNKYGALIAAHVAGWVRENPGPWKVGFVSQEAKGRSFYEWTAGFCVFQADAFEETGDCLVFYRSDGQGHMAFVKSAVEEVYPAPEFRTLALKYRNLQVAAPGFEPDVYIVITKI